MKVAVRLTQHFCKISAPNRERLRLILVVSITEIIEAELPFRLPCEDFDMRRMHILLTSLITSLMLAACADMGHRAPAPGVAVYKYVGSKQCSGGGVPLASMMRQLSEAGVPVMNVSCGTDGRMYPAMCEAPDGHINILEVPEDKVAATKALGFAPLGSLPEASKTICPKKP